MYLCTKSSRIADTSRNTSPKTKYGICSMFLSKLPAISKITTTT